MRKINKIIIGVIVLIVICFSIYSIFFMSRLDQINIFENANINPHDEYFRLSIFRGDKLIFRSENVSWGYLVEYGYVKDGRCNQDAMFWREVVDTKGLLEPGWHYYHGTIKAYY